MKIRKTTQENFSKVSGLLGTAFPKSQYEKKLVENFHANQTPIHEWICIHVNKVIAHIVFSNAYKGKEICGLHLAPLCVAPQFQRQGIGSELVRFALRQEPIKNSTVFVLGNPEFYKRFGFKQCAAPVCPFDKNNRHFLALRSTTTAPFIIGYEPDFSNS